MAGTASANDMLRQAPPNPSAKTARQITQPRRMRFCEKSMKLVNEQCLRSRHARPPVTLGKPKFAAKAYCPLVRMLSQRAYVAPPSTGQR